MNDMLGDWMRQKITDLENTLNVSNGPEWSAWELEFIESMGEKGRHKTLHLSQKQIEIINKLWERI